MAYSSCLITNGAEFFVDNDIVNINTSKARKWPFQEQPYNGILLICRPWCKSLNLTDVK